MKKLYEYTIEELWDMPANELHKLQAETDIDKFNWYEQRPFMDTGTRISDFHEQAIKNKNNEVKDDV
jgi:hypothetical protein